MSLTFPERYNRDINESDVKWRTMFRADEALADAAIFFNQKWSDNLIIVL